MFVVASPVTAQTVADGSIDTTFTPPAFGPGVRVFSVTQVDDKILIGGDVAGSIKRLNNARSQPATGGAFVGGGSGSGA